jgi:hypothetical protein
MEEAFVQNLKEHLKKAKDIKLTSVIDILSHIAPSTARIHTM